MTDWWAFGMAVAALVLSVGSLCWFLYWNIWGLPRLRAKWDREDAAEQERILRFAAAERAEPSTDSRELFRAIWGRYPD